LNIICEAAAYCCINFVSYRIKNNLNAFQGELMIAQPLQGLQWRLDPGPTHLDTCTFQVVSEDGTVLQYRGFIDRGARL